MEKGSTSANVPAISLEGTVKHVSKITIFSRLPDLQVNYLMY